MAIRDIYSPSDIHDIDYFGQGETSYNYKGYNPIVEGNTLAGQVPRGLKPNFQRMNEEGNPYFVKNFLLIDNQWKLIQQVLIEQWDMEGLPEHLDKYKILGQVIKNGSVAFFKFAGDIQCTSSYTVSAKDMYNDPEQIKVEVGNIRQTYNKNQFAILRFDQDGASPYIKVIQYLHSMVTNLRMLHNNTFKATTKGMFINNLLGDVNGKKTPIADAFEDVINSDKTFFNVSLDEADRELLLERMKKAGGNEDNLLFETVKIDDRADSLMKTYNFFKELIKEIVGVDIDQNIDKKERKVTAEITAQQGLSTFINAHRLKVMKTDLEKVNKTFKTNITIDWSQENQIEEEINIETNEGEIEDAI